jgi:anti-sigma factor RsiW
MRLLPSPLVCQQAVELMSDYLDGSLSRRDRRRLTAHLALCDACTAYLEQLRVTIAASGVISVNELSPEVLETLTELFERFRDES